MSQEADRATHGEQVRALVRQLAETEAALQALIGDQVDAVVDPATAEPVLLRRAQARMRENEARLQMLLKQIPSVVWTTDRELVYTSAMGSGFGEVGMQPEALIGVRVDDFVRGSESEAAVAAHRRALSGEAAEYEAEWAGVAYHAWVRPLRDREGQVVGCLGVALDVSARVKMEQALRAANENLEARVQERTEQLSQANEELHSYGEELRRQQEWLQARNQELIASRQELEAERRRYRDLFDFAPDGYLVTDMYGVVREANRAAGELLGVEPRFLEGKPLMIFGAREEHAAFLAQLRRLRGGEANGVRGWDMQVQPRAGEAVDVSITVAVMHDAQGRAAGLRWLMRDVSERVRMEERLRFQANALDQVVDAVIAVDAHERVTYLNRSAAEQYQVDAQAALGRPLDELHTREWLQAEDERAAYAALAETGHWRGENVHVTRAGEQIWVESAVSVLRDGGGREIGTLAAIRDVGARKRAEQERERLLAQSLRDQRAIQELAATLERERDILETIMEHTHAHLAYLDPDFRFVRANAAYARGSGHSVEELIGRGHFELFPNAENEAIFRQVRDTGQAVAFQARPFEYADQPERGTTYWDWSLIPVKDREGAVQGLVFSLLDVTERERFGMEREAHAARMDALIAVSRQVLAETTVQGVLERVVDAARALTRARLAVAGHGYEGDRFRIGVTSCAEDAPPCPPPERFTTERGGPYAELLQGRRTIRLADAELRQHPAWWGLPEGHAPLRGLLGASLAGHGGQAGGLIMVSDREEGTFTAKEEGLLAQLAALASLGLQHIEARDEAERRADELDAVFGAMIDGVVVYDADGVPVRANRAIVAMVGQEVVGMDRAQICAERVLRWPDGRAAALEELPSSRALRGEVVTGEHLAHTSPEGEERVVWVSAAPLWAGESVSGAVLVWRDVTELERLLEENRWQRAFLEQLLDAAPVGIAVLRGLDHRYEYVNPYYQAIPVTPDVDMVGRTVAEVFPDLATQGVPDVMEEVYHSGRTARLRELEVSIGPGRERTYWNADYVPLRDGDGQVERVLAIVSEVTDIVGARQEIERLAARDSAILTSLTEGVIVADLEGNVQSMNPAALRIHGFERPEEAERRLVAYSPTFELRYLDGRPMALEEWPLSRVLRGETFSGLEVRVRRTDDGRTWIASYGGTLVRDAQGDPILGVLTLHDITEHKEIEEERERLVAELADERALLKAIIENTPEGITVVDEASRVLLTNPAGEQIYGRPAPHDDLDARQSALMLCYPDGTPYDSRDLPLPRAALFGETHRDVEMAIFWPDGQRRDLLANAAPIVDDSGRRRGAVAAFRDITERKQMEERLRRYAERLRALRQADQAILAAHSAEEMAEAVLRQVPQSMPCVHASVVLFDLEANEMSLLASWSATKAGLAKGWRGPLEPEWLSIVEKLAQGQAHVVDDVQELAPSPLVERLQAQGVRAHVFKPLLVQGQLIGSLNLGMGIPGPLDPELVAAARELADELAIGIQQARLYEEVGRYALELERRVRRRTALLQVSEARFRAIFEEAAVGMALLDRNGRVMSANPALEAMLGYGAEELEDMALSDLVHPDDVGGERELFPALVAEERDNYWLEQRYARKDGGTVAAEVTVSLVRPARGRPRFAIAMIEDVTQRKQAQAALVQSEKLAVVGRLAASLAHEINNPLQSVIGCLGLAEEILAEGEDASQFMQVAMEELERAARIVAQMRDLSRRSETEKKEPGDVNALVEKVLLLSKKQCQDRRVEVTWEPTSGLPPLLLASDRIQQVFLNLVLNAVDAMPGGGKLRVRTVHRPEPGEVGIAFADDGVGIPPDVLARLFEPFQSTKERGLGLGLYVSRGVVEEHGGRIEVESKIGKGTTFTVWLPA